MIRFGMTALLVWTASLLTIAQNSWPQFRGHQASGLASQQHLPDQWDVASGKNILWKVPIPGLSHASPIIWNDLIFVVTAVSSGGNDQFKQGLYGSGTASDDFSKQLWQIHAISAKDGTTKWVQIAHEGPPRSKRHIKASYANATPATDGEHLIAIFGSEGVFAYDLTGRKLWQKSFGHLNVGAYSSPELEWGHASSPIIHKGLAFFQCDTSAEDFIVALDVKTGNQVWRVQREELPSWGTPTILPGSPDELIANGSNFIMGYAAKTGEELWRLGGSSQITAPTPIFNKDFLFVTSGRRPHKPIFAIRRGVRGDISLPEGETKSKAIAWSSRGRGPYMPTPIIVDNLLFSINNNGIFDCYEMATGKEIFRERMPHGGSGFSASPIGADGKLYLSSEDGDIFVVSASRDFKIIATNNMEELLMATPAMADGKLIVRGHHHLFAIGSP